MKKQAHLIQLPAPKLKGEMSLEHTISKRRSVRNFSSKQLTDEQLSQLLWAAQGLTDKRMGFRSVPSAGALYPLELYTVKPEGVFHYLPHKHSLEQILDKDLRNDLSHAALWQGAVKEAAVDIVITASYERVTSKYGDRGIRYVHIEAGHCAQNIHLQAVALGLGSVPIGAFQDKQVKDLLNLPEDFQPIYIIAVGHTE